MGELLGFLFPYEYAWVLELKPFHAEPHHGVHVIMWTQVLFCASVAAQKFVRKGWENALGSIFFLVLAGAFALWATHTSPLEYRGVVPSVPGGVYSGPYNPPGSEWFV